MKTIEMIARVGDATLTVGKCSSAQARILVKNSHAAWQDGRILLPLDPALLKLAQDRAAQAMPAASESEQRRLEWLKGLLSDLSEVRSRRSDIVHILGQSPEPFVDPRVVCVDSEDQEPYGSEEDDVWFQDGSEPSAVEDLTDLWEAAPNVAVVFQVPAPSMRIGGDIRWTREVLRSLLEQTADYTPLARPFGPARGRRTTITTTTPTNTADRLLAEVWIAVTSFCTQHRIQDRVEISGVSNDGFVCHFRERRVEVRREGDGWDVAGAWEPHTRMGATVRTVVDLLFCRPPHLPAPHPG